MQYTMSAEMAIIAGSSLVGVISATVIGKLSRSKAGNTQPRSTGMAKAELLSLLFEKNLASEAITRVFEASQEGKIDRLERDRLLLKYKQQLDSITQRISHLQPVADLAEMTELRDDLVSVLENRISVLDKKLLEMKSSVTHDAIDERVHKIIAETTKVQAEPIEQKPFKAEEKSIDQLQKEIMHALQRLEQVEIDKD
jgi:hypothetical protein